MILDLLANNAFTRPIYLSSPGGLSELIDIDKYLFMDGAMFKFMPVKHNEGNGNVGILSDRCFDQMMNKFKYGNLNNPKVFVDWVSMGTAEYTRNNFARVAQKLIQEGKQQKAEQLLDKGIELFPDRAINFNLYMYGYADLYYQLGKYEKGNDINLLIADYYLKNLEYYNSLEPKFKKTFDDETLEALQVLQGIIQNMTKYKQEKPADELAKKVQPYLMNR